MRDEHDKRLSRARREYENALDFAPWCESSPLSIQEVRRGVAASLAGGLTTGFRSRKFRIRHILSQRSKGLRESQQEAQFIAFTWVTGNRRRSGKGSQTPVLVLNETLPACDSRFGARNCVKTLGVFRDYARSSYNWPGKHPNTNRNPRTSETATILPSLRGTATSTPHILGRMLAVGWNTNKAPSASLDSSETISPNRFYGGTSTSLSPPLLCPMR